MANELSETGWYVLLHTTLLIVEKWNIPPSRRADLEENGFKGAMEKKQTKKKDKKKGGGVFGVFCLR